LSRDFSDKVFTVGYWLLLERLHAALKNPIGVLPDADLRIYRRRIRGIYAYNP
jgi:hypothetical protein